jgi:hypothetical protein
MRRNGYVVGPDNTHIGGWRRLRLYDTLGGVTSKTQ